jgi:hypothetical protein
MLPLFLSASTVWFLPNLADQTPTPTRFIRYGEEVGLFQDLQNVNPFEEQFKKATDLVKMGEAPLQVN